MCERSEHPRAQRYPRYLELSRKREACLGQGIDLCAAAFSLDELRDLQIWFTLAWFDPVHLRDGPLADLVSRGRDFTEADKQILAGAQADILARVLPAYRRAQAEGRVELTTSPYFHPILPLLINTDLSRISRVDASLPTRRFAHPEDAREQIRLAMEHHAMSFGERPRGMWCSELGVGEDVVPLLTEAGLAWTIADEGVLGRSLGQDIARTDGGRVRDPDRLYHPYRLEREGRSLDIVFRDRVLSDLIGFTYRSWAPQDAAANLVQRLREIRQSAAPGEEPRLVTIALDGENAWEYYQDDGHEFLNRLYETLVGDPGLPVRDRGRVPHREPTSARAALAPHGLLGVRRLLHLDRRSRPRPRVGSSPSSEGSRRCATRNRQGRARLGGARRPVYDGWRAADGRRSG